MNGLVRSTFAFSIEVCIVGGRNVHATTMIMLDSRCELRQVAGGGDQMKSGVVAAPASARKLLTPCPHSEKSLHEIHH